MTGNPKKVVVVGGGVSGMVAAMALTEPELAGKFDVTVYQMGWRLGGKGASGRSTTEASRIEEHGLHIWFGFYDNAFTWMGRCYQELAMLDLAMKQFEEASKEIVTMDAMKKEIVYNLGLVYEQMGEKGKAIDCMKQIYEADYGFRDVAQRVESSYQEKSS